MLGSVAERFAEGSSHPKRLVENYRKTIHPPGDQALWPNAVHSAWRRKNRFPGAVKAAQCIPPDRKHVPPSRRPVFPAKLFLTGYDDCPGRP